MASKFFIDPCTILSECMDYEELIKKSLGPPEGSQASMGFYYTLGKEKNIRSFITGEYGEEIKAKLNLWNYKRIAIGWLIITRTRIIHCVEQDISIFRDNFNIKWVIDFKPKGLTISHSDTEEGILRIKDRGQTKKMAFDPTKWSFSRISTEISRAGFTIDTLGKKDDSKTKKSEASSLFDTLKLHPKIVGASEKLFKDGHYSQAILEAYKCLNNHVKEKSGKSDLDGKDLMAKTFRLTGPILKLNKLKTQSEKDEQEGFMLLYMGAMEGIRNPKAHETVQQKDPNRTLEYLGLASLLIRRVDEATKK